MKSNLFSLSAAALLLVAAVPASAQNLLSNPGFETGGFEDFNVFGQGFRTAGGDDARTGDFGAVNDVLTTDDANQFRGLQQTVDAAAGETYSASVFIRTVAQNESSAFLELEFFDGPEDADGNPTGARLARFESDQVFTDQDFTEAVIDPVVAPAGHGVGADRRDRVQERDDHRRRVHHLRRLRPVRPRADGRAVVRPRRRPGVGPPPPLNRTVGEPRGENVGRSPARDSCCGRASRPAWRGNL